jgi:superfamily II DNA or RNA helicase
MDYLRDYQIGARDGADQALSNGSESALIVMPTGTGKTEVFLDFVDHWLSQDRGGVLVLAHRQELVWQPWDRWHTKTGGYGELEMGEYHRSSNLRTSSVTFASKDTLYRPKRLKQAFPDPKSIGLIIIDEAHHAIKANKTYQSIIDYFSVNPDLRILGVTATPDRTDEQALGQTFATVAYEYPLYDPSGSSAITDGWLCPIEVKSIVVDDINFDNVDVRGGDFAPGQLEAEMNREKVIHRVTGPTMELSDGKPVLTFASGVSHASRMAEVFNRNNPASAYCLVSTIKPEDDHDFVVDSGDRDARKSMLRQFNSGEFQYLCNVGVLTEGYDCPSVQMLSMARPTQSRSLAAQMAGRGTRVLPGVIEGKDWRLDTAEKRKEAIAASDKPCVTILDFVGNSRHNLASVLDVLGGIYPDEVVEKAHDIARQAGGTVSATDVLKEADEAVRLERKERQKIKAKANYRVEELDPFTSLDVVARREPGWHRGRLATPKQKDALRRFKIEEGHLGEMTFWKAHQLMDKLVGRAKAGHCTYKQAKLLTKFGEDADCSFEQASSKIDRIAKNGWRSVS